MAESLPTFMSKAEIPCIALAQVADIDGFIQAMYRETQEACFDKFLCWCKDNGKRIEDFVFLCRFTYSERTPDDILFSNIQSTRVVAIGNIYKSFVYLPGNNLVSCIPATKEDGIKGLEDFYESLPEDIG